VGAGVGAGAAVFSVVVAVVEPKLNPPLLGVVLPNDKVGSDGFFSSVTAAVVAGAVVAPPNENPVDSVVLFEDEPKLNPVDAGGVVSTGLLDSVFAVVPNDNPLDDEPVGAPNLKPDDVPFVVAPVAKLVVPKLEPNLMGSEEVEALEEAASPKLTDLLIIGAG